MDLTELTQELMRSYPDKIIVDVSEHENEDHQTYKFLYESFSDTKKSLEMENANLVFKYQELEKEYSVLMSEIETLKTNNRILSGDLFSSINSFKDISSERIYVFNVKAEDELCHDEGFDYEKLSDTISSSPGVYGSYRPSWFTPAGVEMTKESVRDKNIKNTVPLLFGNLLFWNRNINRLSDPKNIDSVSKDYDLTRKRNIINLLRSDCSNEERYLKYCLLTPGLDREYRKTLNGASKLNIDARLIISFLEQPNDKYNREVIESYVSELHKGTEYNLKQELAEELINGKWIISAEINGKHEQFQLVPVSIIKDFMNKIDEISNFLLSFSTGEFSAGLAENSPIFSENETVTNDDSIGEYTEEYDLENYTNSYLVELDDSML